MKNMLNFKNFTADELMDILNLALDMKKNPEKYAHALEGKKLYTLFEKTSTRRQESPNSAVHITISSGRIPTSPLESLYQRSSMCAGMSISSWPVLSRMRQSSCSATM